MEICLLSDCPTRPTCKASCCRTLRWPEVISTNKELEYVGVSQQEIGMWKMVTLPTKIKVRMKDRCLKIKKKTMKSQVTKIGTEPSTIWSQATKMGKWHEMTTALRQASSTALRNHRPFPRAPLGRSHASVLPRVEGAQGAQGAQNSLPGIFFQRKWADEGEIVEQGSWYRLAPNTPG